MAEDGDTQDPWAVPGGLPPAPRTGDPTPGPWRVTFICSGGGTHVRTVLGEVHLWPEGLVIPSGADVGHLETWPFVMPPVAPPMGWHREAFGGDDPPIRTWTARCLRCPTRKGGPRNWPISDQKMRAICGAVQHAGRHGYALDEDRPC